MTAVEHNRYLGIGFAVFAVIFGLTFLLLMLVSLGVFLALGISFAGETGDTNQVGFGVLGGAFAVVFYVTLGLILVFPTAAASWRMWKRKRHARVWGIIASIAVAPVMPLGTFLGIYGLWFLFSSEGRKFYSSF
jgi:hypothetical protein